MKIIYEEDDIKFSKPFCEDKLMKGIPPRSVLSFVGLFIIQAR